MKNKKHQRKTSKILPDFNLEDILNAPKREETNKSTSGLGCSFCGSLRYTSTGQIRVYQGQRMKVCHCYGCGRDFYKDE